MMWGSGFGWGGMLLTLPGTLLVLALLAVLIWAVLRLVTGKTTTPVSPYAGTQPPGPSALEILHQPYARSEIDAVTYEQMRDRLEPPVAGPSQSSLIRNRCLTKTHGEIPPKGMRSLIYKMSIDGAA